MPALVGIAGSVYQVDANVSPVEMSDAQVYGRLALYLILTVVKHRAAFINLSEPWSSLGGVKKTFRK
jgi:hypothetical protein